MFARDGAACSTLLLPNGPEYIQLVYACSWLGIIIVPINTRLSTPEIDRVLADASPRGLVRHSGFWFNSRTDCSAASRSLAFSSIKRHAQNTTPTSPR
jgi:acyl-CoA synthetase (AMP-forming)/AMP-acid ligase II